VRFEVTKLFASWLTSLNSQISVVAVVGGTSGDPEVGILKSLYPIAEIHYFGIDNPRNDRNFHGLNLDADHADISIKFDLVLCSQVLEHLWNLDNAFNELRALLNQGGYLWLNCPASNMAHGSPHYYSAGYAADYLVRNLEHRGFEIELAQNLGTKRYYFATHILRQWLTEDESKNPILKYNFQPGTFLGVARKYLREMPGRLLSLVYSNKVSTEIEFATESVVLAKLIK
jgi:SAM-dependent methyltransferase